MSKELLLSTVRDRVTSFVPSHYALNIGLLKSGAFALGALVIIDIISTQDQRTIRLVLWGATVSFLIVSQAKWQRGVLLSASDMNIFDVICPTLMGIGEFALFILLSPKYFDTALWKLWYLVVAIYAAAAFVLVCNRTLLAPVLYAPGESMSRDRLEAMVETYKEWLAWDLVVLTVIALLGALTWIFIIQTDYFAECKNFLLISIPSIMIGANFIATWRAIREYQTVEQFVTVKLGDDTDQTANPGDTSS